MSIARKVTVPQKLAQYVGKSHDQWTATSRNHIISAVNFRSGDLGVAVYMAHGGITPSGTPSGWTLLASLGAVSHDCFVYVRVMDGTETQIVYTGSSGTRIETSTAFFVRNVQQPTGSNIDSVTSSTLDPPVVPIPAGIKDMVVVIGSGSASGTGDAITSDPSGYTNIQNIDVYDGTYGHVGRISYKLEPATAENPGVMSTSGSATSWNAATLLLEV